MNIKIELATFHDLEELEQLYDQVNDYLSQNINYPGWRKGIYPVRQTAMDGLKDNNLFVAKLGDKIIGTVILNHLPEEAYDTINWSFETDYSDVYVVHTLAVHPKYSKLGIGEKLILFSLSHGYEQGMRSVRLDVNETNLPAIRLYEKCGFQYVNTVDLGLGDYGLYWFKLYEKMLR